MSATFQANLRRSLAEALRAEHPNLAWEVRPTDSDKRYGDPRPAQLRQLHACLNHGDSPETSPIPNLPQGKGS